MRRLVHYDKFVVLRCAERADLSRTLMVPGATPCGSLLAVPAFVGLLIRSSVLTPPSFPLAQSAKIGSNDLHLWLWARCTGCFFSSCQSAVSCCLFYCSWGCCVLCVALFAPLWCVSGDSCCLRLVWALLECFYSVLLARARGPPFRLGVCFGGFLLLFVLLHLFPPLRL